jgi:hypothetical protein
VSGWLIGIGVILWHALLENDWKRIGGGTLAYAVYSLLQVISLFRFSDQIRFGLSFWVYVVVVISGAGLGWYGWRRANKLKRATG